MNTQKFRLSINERTQTDEMTEFRNGETYTAEDWQTCRNEAMRIISVREVATDKLVGEGFLVGNHRHAEIVDLKVDENFRKQGVATAIMDELVGFAHSEHVKYFGLTYAHSAGPWLKEFYEGYGFVEINFAMWHKDSLPRAD